MCRFLKGGTSMEIAMGIGLLLMLGYLSSLCFTD